MLSRGPPPSLKPDVRASRSPGASAIWRMGRAYPAPSPMQCSPASAPKRSAPATHWQSRARHARAAPSVLDPQGADCSAP
jgi:hypothetical protein